MASSTAISFAAGLGPVDRSRRPALAVGRGHSRRSVHDRRTRAAESATSGAGLGRGPDRDPPLAPRRTALRIPRALGRANATRRVPGARRLPSEPHRRRHRTPDGRARRSHHPGIPPGTTQRRPTLQDPGLPGDVSGEERSKRGDRMVERCVASVRGEQSALIRGRRSEPVAGRSPRRPTKAARRRRYIMADGGGAEAFRLPLSVGDRPIRAGGVMLHRLTGAPVLPLLHHLAGRRHVMTIHPPLPALPPDQSIGPRGLAGQLDASRGRLREAIPRAVPFPGLAHRRRRS